MKSLTLRRCQLRLWTIEVELTPELEAKLDRLSWGTGRKASELFETALTGYVEDLLELRQTLDRRYDEAASGVVELIAGDEVFRRCGKRARRDCGSDP